VGAIRFWSRAQAEPNRLALIAPDGSEVRAGELLAETNRLVHGLRALGLGHGEAVAVVMPNCREAVVAYLAAMQAGWYLVPINYHLTVGEAAYIVADSGARALIGHERVAEVCAPVAEQCGLAPRLRLSVGAVPTFTPLAEFLDGRPDTLPGQRSTGSVMYYTSGTTGRPKGVRRPRPRGDPDDGEMDSGDLLGQYGLTPGTDDVHLCGSPLYHTAVLAFAASSLHFGHRIVLMDGWSPEAGLEAIERYRVSHTHMVPTQFRRLLLLPEKVRKAADCSSLRCVIHGAAPCDTEIKRAMMRWWGPIIYEYYGTTEGGGTVAEPQQWLAHPGTVGKPYPGAEIRILDEAGAQVPPGTAGTVYFYTAWSDFEYLHDPGKTRGNRRGDYVTVGDMGYLDEEGFLFLLGRSAELIVSAGVNVYPAEIESVLVRHPTVADVAVVGEPDEDRGEVPVAYIERSTPDLPGPELEAELRRHCAAELAGFKLPRRFVVVDALPRDPSGKLLKRKLGQTTSV
jgi:long-chain acyl-CoA synthetase